MLNKNWVPMNRRLGFNYFFGFALLLGTGWNARASQNSTNYKLHLQNSLQQTDSSSFVAGYDALDIPQYSLVAAVDTAGANLSAAPILRLPAPTDDFPSGDFVSPTGPHNSPIWVTGKGYNEYHWGLGYPTIVEMSAAFGTGTFTFILGDATAMPTLSLNTVSPSFPISPTVTSGGIWNGGHLLIDPMTGATLTLNTSSFTGYTNGLGGQIKFELVDSNVMPISKPAESQNVPSFGKNDPALTSYTIAPGTLAAGQTYNFQANYQQYSEGNTTSFTGTGIAGNPLGIAGYLTSTFITVDAMPYTLFITQAGNNTTHLQCLGVPNALNRIEWSPDLSPGSFHTLASVNTDGTGAFSYDDASAGTKKFYRLAYP